MGFTEDKKKSAKSKTGTPAEKTAGSKAPAKNQAQRTGSAKPAPSKNEAASKNAAAAKEAKERIKAEEAKHRKAVNRFRSVLFFAVGLLLLALTIIEGSSGWNAMRSVYMGLFGVCTIIIPFVLFYLSVYLVKAGSERPQASKFSLAALMILLLSGVIQVVFVGKVGANASDSFGTVMKHLYSCGKELSGAGVSAAVIGWPLLALLGRIGATIILLLLAIVIFMLLMNITIIDFFRLVTAPLRHFRERYEEDMDEFDDLEDEEDDDFKGYRAKSARPPEKKGKRKENEFISPIDELNNAKPRPLNEKHFEFDIPIPHFPVVGAEEKAKIIEEFEQSNPDEMRKAADRASAVLKGNVQSPSKTEEPAAEPKKMFPELAGAVEKGKEPTAEPQKTPESLADIIKKATVPLKTAKAAETTVRPETEYTLPPLSLLRVYDNTKNALNASEEMLKNSELLVQTLNEFKVGTKVIDIHRGPTVTRYELQPLPGVKIARITSLASDIALKLKAEGVRIEAPIPGKAAVGVEVPNRVKDTVSFREIIESKPFVDERSKSKLAIAVGMDIDGNTIVGDISKMPHVIVAGTTGSGKSVCTRSMIMSILYNASPDEVKLVMIDPKLVEFPMFNGIPHLLIPVVTDPNKAAGALNWAVNEMLRRYQLFQDTGVSDITAFNRRAELTRSLSESQSAGGAESPEPLEKMHHIVIAIDELSDLMMAAKNDVEKAICRLAQMARAAGMHLIVATQRPTVDVVTGLIKANIPSRIALKTFAKIDSMTILDMAGAETLLGNGDMLYFPMGVKKPIRVQGCFCSPEEVAEVVNFLKRDGEAEYNGRILDEIEQSMPVEKGEKAQSADELDYSDDNAILERAMEVAVDLGQVSVTTLQKKLKLGYARASRIMDELEELGVVGPHEGAKPRRVLMTHQQLNERKLRNS